MDRMNTEIKDLKEKYTNEMVCSFILSLLIVYYTYKEW